VDADAKNPSPPLRSRLREKLPEILIEAGSVLLGLLLAFAANAWHERNQDMERADKARAAILAELGDNRKEFVTSRDAIGKVIDDLRKVKKDESSVHEMSVTIPLALLSEAAWHTAQATQAVRDVDYAWMIRVSKVYELQNMYSQMQASVVQQLADIDSMNINTRADVARQLLGRMSTMADLGKGLDGGYAELLDKK
jgi:hypothetical protein